MKKQLLNKNLPVKEKDRVTKAKPLPNPYLNARREWNERYGDYIKRAKDWRLAFFISTAFSVISVSSLAYRATQNKFIPYIVYTDSNGKAKVVIPTEENHQFIIKNKNLIRSQLAQWVELVRTVSSDVDVQKTNMNKAFSYLLESSSAWQVLSKYLNDHSPFKRALTQTVNVHIRAVLPISKKTWQIEWEEEIKNKSGILIGRQKMKGNVEIQVRTPSDEASAYKNPLGLYFVVFNWSKKL